MRAAGREDQSLIADIIPTFMRKSYTILRKDIYFINKLSFCIGRIINL